MIFEDSEAGGKILQRKLRQYYHSNFPLYFVQPLTRLTRTPDVHMAHIELRIEWMVHTDARDSTVKNPSHQNFLQLSSYSAIGQVIMRRCGRYADIHTLGCMKSGGKKRKILGVVSSQNPKRKYPNVLPECGIKEGACFLADFPHY